MRLSACEPEMPVLRTVTANDRLKAANGPAFHWSIVCSVFIHAVLVLTWRGAEPPALPGGGSPGATPPRLIALGQSSATEPQGRPAPVVLDGAETMGVELGSDSSIPDGDQDDETGAGGSAPDGWSSVDRELWRLAAVQPRLAQGVQPASLQEAADVDSPAPPGGAGSDEGIRIRRGTDDFAYQRLSDEEILSLERLSSLRPELVLLSPSNWLILRNPDEVARFIRSNIEDRRGSGSAAGPIAISLWINDRGSVEWAEISRSSGHAQLDDSALELFRRVAAFRPARENGVRVPVAAVFWLML